MRLCLAQETKTTRSKNTVQYKILHNLHILQIFIKVNFYQNGKHFHTQLKCMGNQMVSWLVHLTRNLNGFVRPIVTSCVRT